MMIGFKDHGIRRPQDLTTEMARNRARQGWLTNEQCLAILANPNHYEGLMREEMAMGRLLEAVLDGPVAESFFLCPEDRAADEYAYAYSDKQGVKFGGKWRMTVTRSVAQDYEKREYVMRNGGNLKLVHYRRHNDPELKEKATAVQEAHDLNTTINEYRRDKNQSNRDLLGRIKSALQRLGGRRGRGGRRGG